MKKILCLVVVAALGVAACSKNKKDSATVYYDANGKAYTLTDGTDAKKVSIKDAKYQILDQEFDNLLAAEKDYDSIPDYELQACGDSYLPPVDAAAVKAAKAKAKAKASGAAKSVEATRAKKITNTTNIYYVDGPNPDVPVSSTTTTKTVYTNGAVSSSTTSSSNTKTTVNPDGSVTTTTVRPY